PDSTSLICFVRCFLSSPCSPFHPFFSFFFFHRSLPHRDLHSFPTRRSSDLDISGTSDISAAHARSHRSGCGYQRIRRRGAAVLLDRKSTRLNSSHVSISYAVFCLKKKKKKENNTENKEQQLIVLMKKIEDRE